MNKVILLGSLGQDPELRYTPTGTAILSMRVATSETYVDKNKEQQERVEWHTVVVWGARGEALSRHLFKDSGVLIEGNLRTSSYEKDGQKRYRTEVHAREVCLTGRRAAAEPRGDGRGEGRGDGRSAHPGPAKAAPSNSHQRPRAPVAAAADPLDELPY